jgi:hypothetical protein
MVCFSCDRSREWYADEIGGVIWAFHTGQRADHELGKRHLENLLNLNNATAGTAGGDSGGAHLARASANANGGGHGPSHTVILANGNGNGNIGGTGGESAWVRAAGPLLTYYVFHLKYMPLG